MNGVIYGLIHYYNTACLPTSPPTGGRFIQKDFRSIRTIEPAMCVLNGNIASQFQSTGYQAEPLYSMSSAHEVRRPGGNLRPIPAPPHSLAYIKTATFRG